MKWLKRHLYELPYFGWTSQSDKCYREDVPKAWEAEHMLRAWCRVPGTAEAVVARNKVWLTGGGQREK